MKRTLGFWNAVFDALVHPVGLVAVYTDNDAAARDLQAGKGVCTDSRHKAATQWRKVWQVDEA